MQKKSLVWSDWGRLGSIPRAPPLKADALPSVHNGGYLPVALNTHKKKVDGEKAEQDFVTTKLFWGREIQR